LKQSRLGDPCGLSGGDKGRQVGRVGRVWLELDLELCNGHNVNSIKRLLPAARCDARPHALNPTRPGQQSASVSCPPLIDHPYDHQQDLADCLLTCCWHPRRVSRRMQVVDSPSSASHRCRAAWRLVMTRHAAPSNNRHMMDCHAAPGRLQDHILHAASKRLFGAA
jgi:hypothetical protein